MVGKSSNNKKIVLILVVLALLVVALVVGVIVANVMHREDNSEEYRRYYEKVEMNNVGMDDCNAIQSAYESGVINLEMADDLYENLYDKNENDDYKIYLTLCYAYYVYEKGGDPMIAINRVEKVWPLIEDNEDKISYYGEIVEFYSAAGDTERADYYQQLQEELLPVVYGEEIMEDDGGNDE